MHKWFRWVLLSLLFWGRPLAAQWTSVGNGIEYRQFSLAGPYEVFVARMSRANANCALESMIGSGKLYSGRETVTGQVARYDDAINYVGEVWGQRNDVVVAVNGDFYDVTTGMPTGGQIQSGWYCKPFTQWGGWAGMSWKLDRSAFMGACVYHPPANQVVEYLASGASQTFDGINRARGTNELVLYTHHYDANTHTDNSGVEVIVELPQPLMILTSPARVTGIVREVRQNQGSSLIPFDAVVVSASGSAATSVLAHATVGTSIGFSHRIRDYLPGCTTLSGFDWTRSYASVGGNFIFLRDGVPQATTNAGLINRAPRTAVAFNDTYLFFVVVDGRQAGWSIGMNMTELADFCITQLGATWGDNQDGGGSSVMVVNGVIKNRPSDGSERAVANGLAMINVLPRQQSAVFSAGNEIRTTAAASMRLGPGTHFDSFTTIAADTVGMVQPHPMGGIYAKGRNWWKCGFNGNQGWIEEAAIAFPVGGEPPAITVQPVDQNVAHGAVVACPLQADGTPPLHFQWFKDGDEMVDGGRISGARTATLTLTPAIASDSGAYRCGVSNAHGATSSNQVTLTVRSPDLDRDNDVDQEDFGLLQACFTGAGEPQTDPACQRARLDIDADVDDKDLNLFIRCLSGVSVPPATTCMQ